MDSRIPAEVVALAFRNHAARAGATGRLPQSSSIELFRFLVAKGHRGDLKTQLRIPWTSYMNEWNAAHPEDTFKNRSHFRNASLRVWRTFVGEPATDDVLTLEGEADE